MEMNSSTCKACRHEWPYPDHRLAEGRQTVTYLYEDQFFPGWTIVVLKRHATELFELSREERIQLLEEVTRTAKALAAAFRPVKINYELLGNQLPHIHWHVIPRLAHDPAPRDPVWTVRHDPKSLSASELRERIELIQAHLR
ncbi:MAG: HIT family protein [Nitrospiraceae bacterium]